MCFTSCSLFVTTKLENKLVCSYPFAASSNLTTDELDLLLSAAPVESHVGAIVVSVVFRLEACLLTHTIRILPMLASL